MPKITLCAFADESGSALETQIENLLKNGIYNVELRSVDGVNVGDLTVLQAENIARELEKSGIKVFSLGSPLGKIDVEKPYSEHENLLKRLITTAKIMKTDKIRMFSYFVRRGEYDEWEGEVLERLSGLSSLAKAENITLCHENESEIFGSTVNNCLKILEKTEGIELVFDPANFIMWEESVPNAIEKLHSKALYFHIKDVISATKQIVPSGFGDGCIREIVQKLDRDVTFTIEPHLHVFSGYDKLDKKQLKGKFEYASQPEAFAAAVDAFKKILSENGYIEEDKGVWKK